jgi:hypothetical protein
MTLSVLTQGVFVMHTKEMLLCALATLAVGAAEAKNTEYECDEGNANAGYRIRVVELSLDTQEVIVLKKKNGSASLVEDRKLKRVGSGTNYEFNRPNHRISFKKVNADSSGNWVGTFTIPGKRGSQTIQANCGRVETITL